MAFLCSSVPPALADIKKGTTGDQDLNVNVQLNLDIGLGAQLAMAELREKYTVINSESLRISPSQLLHRLDTRKCHLVIMLDRFYEPDKKYCSQPLFSSDYLILASPNLFPPESEDLDALFQFPLLYDALESESPMAYQQRCQREITHLGLSPSEVIWLPNADSAYSRAEISHGIVIASAADRVGFGRHLIGYPVGKTCQVLAIWRADDTNTLVRPYVQFMFEAYQRLCKDTSKPDFPTFFYSGNT